MMLRRTRLRAALVAAFPAAALSLLLTAAPAHAECPGGVDVGGAGGEVVCGPSPTPSPSPTKKPKPTPKPTPTTTQTSSPRPTQTRPTEPAPQPSGTSSSPSTPGSPFPGFPTDFPTSAPSFPPGFGEQRPAELGDYTMPTGPGLAAQPGATSDRGQAMKIIGLLVGAAVIGGLLVRARVRRWMIGI